MIEPIGHLASNAAIRESSMKAPLRTIIAFLYATVSSLALPSAQALTESDLATIDRTLNRLTVAELPLKSAEITARAPSPEREATAVAVVRSAVTRKPAAAVAVVASTVRAAPSAAPAVAAAAARLAPDQAEDIAKAAALAAPQLANESAIAVSAVVPRLAERSATAVRSPVPGASTAVRAAGSAPTRVDASAETLAVADKRLETDGPGHSPGFPLSHGPDTYGSPGHPPHPVHPPHPTHPPHPDHPPHPSHGPGDGGDHGRP